MPRRVGPVKVRRYRLEFKLKAVKLSQLKGVEVQAVADALEIHPFMLSRWRKEAGDGVLRGRASVPKVLNAPPARDVKRFQALRRAHALLGSVGCFRSRGLGTTRGVNGQPVPARCRTGSYSRRSVRSSRAVAGRTAVREFIAR